MRKTKPIKKHPGISPERLAELRSATLIASTGSSLRLSGSKVTNEQVEQILSGISKPSVRKLAHRTNRAFLGKSASNSV